MNCVPRIEKETGKEILFFPGEEVNFGNIEYFAPDGGHGEASMEYYRTRTKHIPKEVRSILFDKYQLRYDITLVRKEKIMKKDRIAMWYSH